MLAVCGSPPYRVCLVGDAWLADEKVPAPAVNAKPEPDAATDVDGDADLHAEPHVVRASRAR